MFILQLEDEAKDFFLKLKIEESELDKILIAGMVRIK